MVNCQSVTGNNTVDFCIYETVTCTKKEIEKTEELFR